MDRFGAAASTSSEFGSVLSISPKEIDTASAEGPRRGLLQEEVLAGVEGEAKGSAKL
tara:strand:+ start:289 stop:459 length:171 start_codon:yes stop_codon:yes gene_type:complete